MLLWLLHLWAHPPIGAMLVCPEPRTGEVRDPGGLYNAAEIATRWQVMAGVSFAVVIGLLLFCYLVPRASLNRGFVVRWWITWAVSGVLCLIVPLAVGLLSPVHARAGSCSTRPAAFEIPFIPFDLLLPRMVAGLMWGLLAFTIASVLATKLLGKWSGAGGFFHYRGCPLPRWNPGQG
ncbi:MAG TPA: hypothetical protein VEX86_07455 [Longimicrobium sp.]|nr:hypothetical protein [Longimicrobium sp.]